MLPQLLQYQFLVTLAIKVLMAEELANPFILAQKALKNKGLFATPSAKMVTKDLAQFAGRSAQVDSRIQAVIA